MHVNAVLSQNTLYMIVLNWNKGGKWRKKKNEFNIDKDISEASEKNKSV